MIAVHYFASIREALGREHEEFDLPEKVSTIDQLIDYLVSKNGESWEEVLKNNAVMVAVNHTMSSRQSTIRQGDEIAFFPPVTGG